MPSGKSTKNDYPLVSIVIPTYNRREKLIRLIDSALQSRYPKDKIEIIVVDDASTDGTYHLLLKYFKKIKKYNTKIKIIRNSKSVYVAKSRNIGANVSNGEYLLFIDDDVWVEKNCIRQLVFFLKENPDFVAVTPLIFDVQGDVWSYGVKRYYTGINLSKYTIKKPYSNYIEVDECVTIYLICKKDFEIIGGYDELLAFFYEESDMFHKLKKFTKKKVACLLSAKAFHDIDKNKLGKLPEIKSYLLGRNRIIFYSRWCNSRIHFVIATLVFLMLIFTYYLIIFKKSNNIVSWVGLIKGFIDGVTKTIKDFLYGIGKGL